MTAAMTWPSWPATLQLGFAQRDSRTVLHTRIHRGPLVVQKPFYPGDGACHVYVLHPPGGLVGGDQLLLQVQAEAHTRVLLTTPAANKIYRSEGIAAAVQQQLAVADDACLEWLPQETILYRDCRAQLQTRVELAPHARFIGWEVVCLGRPEAQEQFDAGRCEQAIEVWRGAQPLVIERTRLRGDSPALQAAWGWSGYPVSGTMIVTPLRETWDHNAWQRDLNRQDRLTSVTQIGEVLIARALATQARPVLGFFQQLWTLLRPSVLGLPASPPRIWAS